MYLGFFWLPYSALWAAFEETYAKSLEEQLRKGVEVLAATHKQQTETLRAAHTEPQPQK